MAEPQRSGEAIAIVSGGFPCQPHSVAGKRQASADDRDLWPEFARVIREIRPRWVVAENVPGLLHSESGRFFGSVLGDLAEMGYSAGWGVWGAADVGALHRRERVFIVAYDSLDGRGAGRARGLDPSGSRERESERAFQDVADAGSGGCARSRQPIDASHPETGRQGEATESLNDRFGYLWRVESDMGRSLDGIRGWLDGTFERGIPRVARGIPRRVQRLRALGNAVVPHQAYPLLKAIVEIEGINA